MSLKSINIKFNNLRVFSVSVETQISTVFIVFSVLLLLVKFKDPLISYVLELVKELRENRDHESENIQKIT